jgi:hypothetical protein
LKLKQKRLHNSFASLCTSASKMPVLLTGIFLSLLARQASTGSRRAALRAGSQPNSTPVSVEHKNAVNSANGEKPISQPGKTAVEQRRSSAKA